MIRAVFLGSLGAAVVGLAVPGPSQASDDGDVRVVGDLPAGWAETSPGFVVPDDTFFREQWWLFNFGQTIGGQVEGKADADIRAPEAWAVTRGTPEVVVAVLDFGVDYEHADLRDRIWTNPRESGGKATNGIDDDGNGYVDDSRGWDFIDSDNTPMDEDGHGTHVAGMIAAQGGDGAGVTGIAPEVRILPLRVGDTGVDQTITPAAIEYAAAAGAQIVVMSYRTDPSGLFDQSAAETAAMVKHRDMLFVAGAGNDAIDYGSFDGRAGGLKPCNNPDVPNLLCVAGTDRDDEAWSESTFGAARVHLGAPAESLVVVSRPREVVAEEPFADQADWEEPTGELGSFWTPSGPPAEMTFEEDPAAGDGQVLRISHSPGEGKESVSVLTRLEKVDLTGREGCTARGSIAGSMSDIATLEIGAFRDEDQRLNPFGGSTSLGDDALGEQPDEFMPFSFPLTSGQPVELMIKLTTSLSSENDVDVRLDDLVVDCWNKQHGDRDFEYWAGTSFATPLVAGVAALVESAHSGLDPLQVKRAILDSVVPLPSLKGKVSTGGRLDAYGALLRAGELTGSGDASTSSAPSESGGGQGEQVSFGSHDDYVLPTEAAGVPKGRGEPDPAAGESSKDQSDEGGISDAELAWLLGLTAAGLAAGGALANAHYRGNAKQKKQIEEAVLKRAAQEKAEKEAVEALARQQEETRRLELERIRAETMARPIEEIMAEHAPPEDHRIEISQETFEEVVDFFSPPVVTGAGDLVENTAENFSEVTASPAEIDAWIAQRKAEYLAGGMPEVLADAQAHQDYNDGSRQRSADALRDSVQAGVDTAGETGADVAQDKALGKAGKTVGQSLWQRFLGR